MSTNSPNCSKESRNPRIESVWRASELVLRSRLTLRSLYEALQLTPADLPCLAQMEADLLRAERLLSEPDYEPNKEPSHELAQEDQEGR